MRVGERIIWYLASTALSYANGEERIEAFETVVRKVWPYFELVYSDASKTALEQLTLSRQHAANILKVLDDDDSEPCIDALMDNSDEKYELWSDALSSWVKAVRIMRKTLSDDDPLPGTGHRARATRSRRPRSSGRQ